MEYNHILSKDTALWLTAIDNHASLERSRTMIFPSANANAFCLQNSYNPRFKVKFYNLVCALTNLSLWVIHETASKKVQFIVVLDRTMTLTPINHFLWLKLYSFPVYLFWNDTSFYNFFDWLITHASNHKKRASTII